MIRLTALIIAIAFGGPLHAAGGGEEKDPSPYLELDPDFVLNIGNPEKGRNYVKADVALRFANPELRKKAQAHEPWLRHELVMLLSGQPVERMTSSQGQQKLQEEAQAVLNRRLQQEMPEEADSLARATDADKDSGGSGDGENANAPESKNGNGSNGKDGNRMIREVLFEMIVRSR